MKKSCFRTVKDTVVRELKYVREGLDEAREANSNLEEVNRDLKARIAALQTDYDSLAHQHEEALSKTDKAASSEDDEVDGPDLRLRVAELEAVRKNLERDLASLRATASSEDKAVRENVTSLKMSLEEAMARERKLQVLYVTE